MAKSRNTNRVTPRDVKIAVREGRLLLPEEYPEPPANLSAFQRGRIAKAMRMVNQYIREERTVIQLARGRARGRTHQRVSQVLQFGIDYLISRGHIRPPGSSRAA